MSDKKFIRLFLAVFFSALVFVAVANYIIDPFGFHFHSRYTGFNRHKPGFIRHTRIVKLYNADAIRPDAIFLGNSRILYLAPEEAFGRYRDHRYYNFSLSSGTLNEMNDLLSYSIRNYDIEYVCYGIDFIAMLSWTARYGSTFDTLLVNGSKSKLVEFLKMHSSIQAVKESAWCVLSNIRDPEGKKVKYHYNEYGSRTNRWRELNYAQLGEPWMDQQMESVLDTYQSIYRNPGLTIPDYKKTAYRSILKQCRDNNIAYTAFINPLYKDHFALLITSGAYPLYIEFIKFLAEEGGIWYFGGINGITSDRGNFWDSQHPRKAMSGVISKAIFSPTPPSFTNALFGRYYDSRNVDTLVMELERLKTELESEN
jgi:hypothetical protein